VADIETSDAEGSGNNNNNEDEGEDDMVDTMTETGVDDNRTFREHFQGDIATIREICKWLEYQYNSEISACWIHWNVKVHRFCGWAEGVLGMNSMRGPVLTTLEKGASNAMFYRMWPRVEDVDT
jgi:hypothetical protein